MQLLLEITDMDVNAGPLFGGAPRLTRPVRAPIIAQHVKAVMYKDAEERDLDV